MKGAPSSLDMGIEHFRRCLYDDEYQVRRTIPTLQYDKKESSVVLKKINKRVLSTPYTKLYVDDTYVRCKTHQL